MFKNYLLIAFRNVRRNKMFSAINILGLAIGISASLVIFLIVQYSHSFDQFEKDGNRIFRVVSDYSFVGNQGHTRGVPGPLSDAIVRNISGIDNVVTFRYYNPEKLTVPKANPSKPVLFKKPQHVIFADKHYFDLLPYEWIVGSKSSALASEGQVVLSESRAKLYFPGVSYADMIGQKIIYDDSLTAQVSGVVADLVRQGNTTFNFLEFISLNSVLRNTGLRAHFYWDDWGATTSDHQVYLRLGDHTTKASVEKGLKAIFEKNQADDNKKNHSTWTYVLQPLDDIHFNSDYGNFGIPLASRPVLLGLILVAIFLILVASINFINLTTAQASQRAKEIGVRKTMGGSRRQLILQFLGETLLITILATILSILLAPVLLQIFSGSIPEGVHFSIMKPLVIGFIVVLAAAVSLLAGLYPAWVLSSSNPLDVLKSRPYSRGGKTRKTWLRKTLTISQFIIAQFFVIGAALVSKQIHFMLNKDLGFSKEALLSMDLPSSDTSIAHKKYFLNELKKNTAVHQASLANDLPSSFGWWTTTMDYGGGKDLVTTKVELKAADENYLHMLHIPLVAGRDLLPGDTTSEILINETYAHTLGFKQAAEAVGKTMAWNNKKTPVVGIFRDFNAHPLIYKIAPMAFCLDTRQSRIALVSLPGDRSQWPAAVAGIKKTFLAAYPGEEFKSEFLDEHIADAYNDVKHTAQLLTWATGLTIFISCLGLLGLAIYSTTRRTKEIGIRKVLGASVGQIMTLLSGDFVKLVSFAFLIATPLSWWATHAWLDDFVFRTPISWWIFLAAGIGMIGMALLTVSFQTARTAMANPVKSLMTE